MDGRTYGNIYLFTTQYSYPVVNNVYVSNNPAQPFSAITEPVATSEVRASSFMLWCITTQALLQTLGLNGEQTGIWETGPQ